MRYELRDGRSSKFWTLERDPKGKTLVTSWGRIGTTGQTAKKKFKEPIACAIAYHKLLNEKLAKGYRIPSGMPAREVKRNTALEAAICDDPADKDRWSVYADWLQQGADPCGELIALHVGKKTAAAKAYAKKHAAALWGAAKYLTAKRPFKGRMWEGWDDEQAEYESLDLALKLGPYGGVDIALFNGLDEAGHVASAVGDLLDAPLGRFVQDLRFTVGEEFEGGSGQPSYEHVALALGAAQPQALRSLSFTHSGYQRSWTESGDLTTALAAMPRLENLSISLGTITLGKRLDLPALKSLRLMTGGLAAANVRAIAAADWPNLEELVIYFGTSRYGATVALKDVRALLAGSFPKLRKLALCNSEDHQAAIAALAVSSKLVKQLTSLDLTRGTMMDSDAAPILAAAKALAHLDLDLSENYFSPVGEKQLRKAFGKRVNVGAQRHDEMLRDQAEYGHEDWAVKGKHTFRYAAVGE